MTSVAPDDAGFDPARYWRGPIWPIINWVLRRGLRRYGFAAEAEQIRTACLELARREGFWEHYNALDGHGQGIGQFAWTAGLVLNLLGDRERPA